jgi:hypothetical protein
MSQHCCPAKTRLLQATELCISIHLAFCFSFFPRTLFLNEAPPFSHDEFKQALLDPIMAPPNGSNRTYPLPNACDDRIRDDMASGISWRFLGVILLPRQPPALQIKQGMESHPPSFHTPPLRYYS